MVHKHLKQIANQSSWYRLRNESVVKDYQNGKRIEEIAFDHNLSVPHTIRVIRALSEYKKECLSGYGNR